MIRRLRTRRQRIRFLEECLEWQRFVRRVMDDKRAQSEREPAEAYWYGGCP